MNTTATTIRLNEPEMKELKRKMKKTGYKSRSKFFTDMTLENNQLFKELSFISKKLESLDVGLFDDLKYSFNNLQKHVLTSEIVNSLLFKKLLKLIISDKSFETKEEFDNYLNDQYNEAVETAQNQILDQNN